MPERFLASVLPQHEAAELYRLMVVGIREVAVFLMDPSGHITVWNKGAQEMKGYAADEALGSHLGMLYTDEDRANDRPRHNLSMAAENSFYSEETRRKRKDGSLFWAHIALTALRSPNNELLGVSKVTMDLTGRRLLEECTKEKEEINQILNAADSGTWKWNVHHGQVDISTHLMHLLGYQSDSAVTAATAGSSCAPTGIRPASTSSSN